MKHSLAVGGALAVAALAVGAPAAQAGEQHEGHRQSAKAEQRQHDRKVERRAERAATKPPQETTKQASSRPSRPGRSDKPVRGVVSCGVTGTRAGTAFTIVNGCDTAQTITVSIQAQPAAWHKGLCEAGGCHLISRYTLMVQPGTTQIHPATDGACWTQVDVKGPDGRLLTSNHYVNDCRQPDEPGKPNGGYHPQPTAPVTPDSPAKNVPTTDTDELAFTGVDLGIYGKGIAVLVGGGVLLVGLTRQPRAQRKAWKR